MPTPIQARFQNGKRLLSFNGQPPIPADATNMRRAREEMPNLQPVPLGLQPSFGFGDRTGLATPGHVAALNRSQGGIQPIFPQQSIREMSRTGRTPQQVMDEACFGMLLAGHAGPTGADADHLKTPADVDATAAAGFVFFTIDPSDHVDGKTDEYGPEELQREFGKVAGEVGWLNQYKGKSVKLPTGTMIELDERACLRAAVKYGRAVNHTVSLAGHIDAVMGKLGRDYEIELSVDETPQPTTLAEHYIVAHQCLSHGMKLVSLAPRYIGDFEKGVDYKGDLKALERSLADHAAVASMLGPYKLSLHSGSDKLSIYTIFARQTKGRFHVKTAGTSYLEALRAVARHDVGLFRRIIDFARGRYDQDRATYHVSATLESVPPPSEISDSKELERQYLELWPEVKPQEGFTKPGRQILHCTFGSVLTHPQWSQAMRDVLEQHPETYKELLAEHFEKHLQALNRGIE